MGTVLTVNNINVYYGAIHAIKGISLDVNRGEIVTLIGANGAGKSTTLHTISGLLRSRTGDIEFLESSISHVPAHKIVSMGISHVPEGRRIFQGMTVEENLQMGAFVAKKDRIAHNLEYVYEQFPRLKESGRAFDGSRTYPGRPDIRDHQEPQQGGYYHPSGRAERADGAVGR